jgi:hypothetical protein
MEENIPNWAQDMKERLVRLETKLDQYNSIREAAYNAKNLSETNSTDIAEIKGNLTWLWRTIAMSIIAGITGLYFKLKG